MTMPTGAVTTQKGAATKRESLAIIGSRRPTGEKNHTRTYWLARETKRRKRERALNGILEIGRKDKQAAARGEGKNAIPGGASNS